MKQRSQKIVPPPSPPPPQSEPLSMRVLRFIQRHGLILPGETIVVGTSGGPDSLCLLFLLAELQPQLKVNLHPAHLNHMLRGEESREEAAFVAQVARLLGMSATIEQRDVESYRRSHRCSLEEAAREVRYRFFAEVAKSVGATKVAVGHTADDQIETILMHLVRGAGAEGLRGMQPLTVWRSPRGASQLTVVRPLLSVYREETEAYCREHQLTPRRDPSNVSLSFLRNRIRHQLLPLLQSFNPRFGEALLRTARILGEETAFFEAETARLWSDVAQEREEGLVLNLAKLTPLHPAVQRYLLRSALRRVLGDLRDIEEKHIEKLRAALSLPPGSRVSLPQGLTFSRGYGEGIIGTSGHISCPFLPLEGEFPLSVPGESVIPGWKVRAVIREERERKLDGEVFSAPGLQACFDLEAAGRELSVRSRRPGDRFQPLGMAQPKKLQDFMVDAKIPRQWRDRIPLVCSPHRILWVAGWRIDERAKVTSTTKQVLCLEFIPQCPSSASSS